MEQCYGLAAIGAHNPVKMVLVSRTNGTELLALRTKLTLPELVVHQWLTVNGPTRATLAEIGLTCAAIVKLLLIVIVSPLVAVAIAETKEAESVTLKSAALAGPQRNPAASVPAIADALERERRLSKE